MGKCEKESKWKTPKEYNFSCKNKYWKTKMRFVFQWTTLFEYCLLQYSNKRCQTSLNYCALILAKTSFIQVFSPQAIIEKMEVMKIIFQRASCITQTDLVYLSIFNNDFSHQFYENEIFFPKDIFKTHPILLFQFLWFHSFNSQFGFSSRTSAIYCQTCSRLNSYKNIKIWNSNQ